MKQILKQLSKAWLAKKTPNFRRNLYDKIDFGVRLIGIKGGRGAGKTTLLQQYAKNSKYKPSQTLYLSCDAPMMEDEVLFEVATEFEQFGGKLLLIDEIHKVDNFSAQIKAIYDFLALKVIFTGSSAMILNHESADLSRRATIHSLPPLSLREFVALKSGILLPGYPLEELVKNHEDISFEVLEKIKPLEQFSLYQKYGAYPFFKESIADYPSRLLDVINLTIESDLSYIFNVDALKQNSLKRLLNLLCSAPPYEISKSKLSKDIEISWVTLSKYLHYMEEGGLVNVIAYQATQKRLNKPPKILLNNPNLFHVLCANPNSGSVRESYFISQLAHHHTIHAHHSGDFMVDNRFLFEIGGRSKGDKQVKAFENSFVVRDDIETGYNNVIPLWLFGFVGE
jgi:hypothetical protein